MRLPPYMEWGNYGGPYHTSGNWYKDELGYHYNEGVAVQDGLDTIFKAHDKAYGYTEIRLEGGDITPGQAAVKTMSADLQLIKDSMLYNPITDPLLPNDKIPHAVAYCGGVITAFTAKMIYDIGQLISTGSEDAIAAAGKLVEDLLSSGANVLGGILGSLLDDRLNELSDLFTTATTTTSPIALDLDGDGIETIASGNGTYFDHNSNGFAEKTGWVGEDDGLLALDRNGNGLIDNGGELFGNQTVLSNGQKANNGFQALADLDDNKDGQIDTNDSVFNQLRIWRDSDGDGEITYGVDENGQRTTDELYTLSELGIQSINTGYTESSTVDTEGNTHKQIGSFTRDDGTTSAAEDVWFKTDNMYTIANEWLDVPEDIARDDIGDVVNLQTYLSKDASFPESLFLIFLA